MKTAMTLELAPAARPVGGRVARCLFRYFLTLLFRFYCPLKVYGRENLPAMPYILCSNHCSHIDGLALIAASGSPAESFGLVAARDYFTRNAILGRIARTLLNLVTVERTSSFRSLKEAVRMCRLFFGDGNRSLIIFPEGTRSVDGTIGRFRRGVAVLALELMVPIVPVYLEGTRNVLAKGHCVLKPSRITVRFGSPICRVPSDPESVESFTEVTQEVYRRISDMQRAKNEG